MNEIPKVVFSRTLEHEPGKDMLAWGGAALHVYRAVAEAA